MADDDHLDEREVLTPDELCAEISKDFEGLEITEDETETLLQEALSLNKRLKAELRRQSHPEGGTGLASSLDSSPLAAKPPRHGGKGARTLLPPIRNNVKPHGADSSSKKSPAQKVKKMTSDRTSLSAGSTTRKPSASKGKPRGSRSADNRRPEWNDRFSF
ncbi:uncharacterized protein [Amphiura filiformis]|uniref:uncharacterized protein n=1 Tax=Amphiura filiformis TaxID=82378 RepID=UPI003B21CE27